MEELLTKILALDIRSQQELLSKYIGQRQPEDQLDVLAPAVTAASGYVKWRLTTLLQSQDTPDFLTLLPPELQLAVLQLVDGPSLLNAAQVSRSWNRMMKSHSQLWCIKCCHLGVNMDKLLDVDVTWHQVYVLSLRQQLALKNGTAFSERFMQLQNCKKAVKAVDYQQGFLCTVSEEDYVNIWQLELNIPLLTFPVEQAVSCIKFKPNSLLVCGHFVGILTAWNLSQMSQLSCLVYDNMAELPLFKGKFKMHAGPVFSCDFSEELDLLVSGGGDGCIKLWCLSSGLIVKSLSNQDHWVLRVILLTDLQFFKDHMLICMTRDSVNKMTWSADNSSDISCESAAHVEKSQMSSSAAGEAKSWGDLENISTISQIRLNEGNNNFFTPGLQYSEKFIGLIKQDIDEKSANLCVYDIKSFTLFHNISLNFKVKKLLAIGNRYALLLTIGNVLYSSTLLVVDIITGQVTGSHSVPHSKMTTPDGAQLVVGDTEWLDGLGDEVLERQEPSTLTKPSEHHQRQSNATGVTSPQEEKCHTIHNEAWSESVDVENDKLTDSMEIQEGNCVGGDTCHNVDVNDAKYLNANDLSVGNEVLENNTEFVDITLHKKTASGICQNNNNDTATTLKLARCNRLVLAAGVHSEPGRLFTLWWCQSQQLLKCKEE